MKTGVIDVGGGMRASYGAGVFDWCMDNDIHFDYCIGVSAGSANIVSYLAGQRGRNYVFYTDYDLRDESMSLRNYVRTRNFVDLEYAYGKLSNSGGEYPLDFAAALANPAEFKIVATDAFSGKPRYFDKTDMSQDDYGAIKASSCVPAANRPYYVYGNGYYDGGMSDPIPLEKCFEAGCDRVVLVLTRPKDFERDPRKDAAAAAVIRREFPKAAEALSKRALVYNTELWVAKQYEKKGKVLIVAPDDIGGMSTLTRDPEMIDILYHKGYKDAEAIKAFMA
ncbi:MAG: patatin family protein [Mogibacterium sp.]|nr:patatin family protein [Mogibacterium sp.]